MQEKCDEIDISSVFHASVIDPPNLMLDSTGSEG
jgi:hypothetical protein